MTRNVLLLFLVGCIVLAAHGTGTTLWDVEAEEDGIRVESREVEGSGVRAFHATVDVNGSAESILALMDDPASYLHWVHGCSHSVFLSKPDFFHRLSYQINDMPFLITDRDLVMWVVVTAEAQGEYQIWMSNRPDAHPEQGLVRVNRLQGFYRLIPLDAEHTRIVWEQHIEPGGYLPDWLVNQLLRNIPLNSLRNLRGLIEDPDSPYRHKRLLRDLQNRIVGWAN